MPGAGRRLFGRLSRRMGQGMATLGLLVVMAGCSTKTPQSTMDVHGLVSRTQLDLFLITVWVCLFIFVTVGGTMAFVVWKYRERPGDENKPMPEQGHGNPMIEISLITASIALLVIIAVPTLKAIFLTQSEPTNEPYWKQSLLGDWYVKAGGQLREIDKDQPLIITVLGKQWWWSFAYEQFGITTANEFYMPAGKVVKFVLRSDNVIHSFWLPKIAGKVDCMPGRANWMWMMADDGKTANDGYDHGPISADKYEYGLYYGQCAQYCGEAHAFMLFRTRIVSDEDFVAWVKQAQQGVKAPAASGNWTKFISAVNPTDGSAPDKSMLATAEERGAAIFFGKRGQCVLCHTIDGSPATGMKGPNLTHVAARTSIAAGFLDNLDNKGEKIDAKRQEENFFEWVKNPLAIKPGNLMWYDPSLQNGLEKIYAEDKANGVPMTDADWHDLAAFLMSLK